MTLLKLDHIHKTFEKGTVNENHVLRGLDLTVEAGDFISIIGGNGAGKSTLMNSIAGVVRVDSGDILLEGQSIKNQPVYERASQVSRVFQDPRLGTADNLSIERNMAVAYKRGKKRGFSLGVTNAQRATFKEALAPLGLGLEERLNVDAAFLSGGQRQALTLVMATLVKPKLLLLDEHTAALDPKTSDMVMRLTDQVVREKELTALMITHNMEHALEYGNRLIMLHQGRIVVDVRGEEKKSLTVPGLLELFQKNSGDHLSDDNVILG